MPHSVVWSGVGGGHRSRLTSDLEDRDRFLDMVSTALQGYGIDLSPKELDSICDASTTEGRARWMKMFEVWENDDLRAALAEVMES